MAHHHRNPSIASSTKTVTPTDSWESYFDSWRLEDGDVSDMAPPPAPTIIEPLIVDDELYHPESLLNARIQLDRNLGLDLDRDFQEYHHDYQDRCSPKVFGRLNDANPANKRHAICVSNRRAMAAGYCQGHNRRDRRPVTVSTPIDTRPDDVDRTANMGRTQPRQPFAARQEENSRSGHACHGGFARRTLHRRRSECRLESSSIKRPHRALQRKEHFNGGLGNPQRAEPPPPPVIPRHASSESQCAPYYAAPAPLGSTTATNWYLFR
ncbi:hypothetical protein Z517_00050 [Fonsecaea pedrosoi CBS 271.37]|uniref:Unplaced genomic scaffold supercont1.1, whole genome shotgun sequence n=1 Tax=Fonsecaea pedrosoi CBS 271.37 TaxID=1442368 RepID=A0A0D2FDF6_9EURO|nr:uncharacterized protein Z517_00050 [Fonsecaea pedrosoi CBS 271.37]KIW84662.1 hypothetical protein Z517_00050 [Fonsecaea pedrosoi CBS 271.37]